MNHPVKVIDAGTMDYRAAWDYQLELHAQVVEGLSPAGVLILVEHPPVITIGRRLDAQRHLLASPAQLQARGVQVVETDRGGDITFHGPGQLVAYPIIPLNAYHLNLHGYLRFLEEVIIHTIAAWGLAGRRLEGCTGVWVQPPGSTDDARLSKVCAIGIKVKRWITLHGLALNVTTDTSFFELINPCGLSRPVTSLQQLLGPKCPGMDEAKKQLAGIVQNLLSNHPGQ